MITPFARGVKGLNKVTNADLNLAPQEASYHVASAAFVGGSEHEIRVGVHDLRAMIEDRFDVFVAQSYYGKWHVNRGDLKLGILPRIEICTSLVTARIDLSRHVFADLTQALQSVRD